ncbi:hypothetical protein [Rubricoccus marinus]|uniref:Uncharacterized protein n=1 Tax=Rubricoccus marinus TaxID=716817 RepID=A0A259U321_9BACT|nr:hypothetical protein [Rubricoccus marinus]OZC04352.1 hypothetical protein BSZ36_16025 [Rubricoccus marinus]
MPKRFTEADAQRIFAAAAERQLERKQTEPGLSLEELEEIGRTSGLDPELVREAAMDALRPDPAATTKTVMGIPLAFRRERFVRGTVTPETWAEIVMDLRRQFDKPGLVTDIGPLREWRSVANDQQQPVTVTLSPERDGTRVVIEQSQTNAALGLGIATGINAVMGVVFALIAVTGVESDMFVPAIVMLLFAALFGGGSYGGMRAYASSQIAKFDATLDRIDLALRNAEADAQEAEPLAEAPPARSGRIDAALLDDEPEAETPLADRLRSRA